MALRGKGTKFLQVEAGRPHRILLLSYCLDLGGSERQLTEIARALDPKRYEVFVGCQIAGGLRMQDLRDAGIPIVAFPMRSFFSVDAVQNAWRLARYIRTQSIDLVHAFDVPMDMFAVPPAKMSLRPVVLSSQRAHRSLTRGAHLPILRATDRMVDGIVVNCEFIRNHLVQEEGVRPEKIHLCYNGLDLKAFCRDGAEFEMAKRSHSGITVGCVCALRPEKNLPLLVRAFAKALQNELNLRLLLVGSGPVEKEIAALIGELGIADNVTLAPATSDVPRWLREIDIFVLPSRTEALSNALMEAMACGCAVVASDVGGNPELIGRDERGLLFPSENEDALAARLLTLARDPDLRSRLSEAARHFVFEKLTIAASVQRMGQIYDSFFKGR